MKYIFFLLILCLVACDKNDNENNPPLAGPACRITAWQDTFTDRVVRNNVFAYNQYGNPVSVSSEHCCSGFPEQDHFLYDSLQRLIQHQRVFVYQYLYTGSDSVPYGAIEHWPHGQRYAMQFTYDNQQRIIKVISDYISSLDPQDSTIVPQHREFIYTYDGNGNLINDQYTSADYTNKPSIYKTNKWWPLIHLNFSENSLNVGSNFNDCGYPTMISRNIFLGLGPGIIEYE